MQSQSEIYKSKLKAKTSNSNNSNNSNNIQQQQQQQLQSREQQRLQQQSSTSAATTAIDRSEAAVGVCGGVGKKSPPLPQQRRATVKVIKCKKPLCHFKFYLDICDHHLAKRIEDQIRTLGGALEFFLTASVTHFITDKAILPTAVGNANNINNNNTLSSRPSTPQTPGSPQTPYAYDTTTTTTQDGKTNINCAATAGSAKKVSTRQTRANAILNRVRRASTTTTPNNSSCINVDGDRPNSPTTAICLKDLSNSKPTPSPSIVVSTQNPYIVWQTEYALHFFKKVQHELKDYIGIASGRHLHQPSNSNSKLFSKGAGGERNIGGHIDLKGGGFLKIESIKRNYRPYYQLFRKSSGTEWPKIELTREDGAFRLSPKKKQLEIIIETTEVAQKIEVDRDTLKDNDIVKMTRKSRSRSSQNQRAQLHNAVKSSKKVGGGVDSAATVKSSQRNSHAAAAGGGVAGAAAGCKQLKESSEKQCGVCEICKIEYDTLTIHLKTKDHEYFAKNSQNFIALDSLIHTSADVSKFLSEDKKVDLEEMEVENIGVVADENAPDPLEGSEPLLELTGDEKHRLGYGGAGTPQNTPSPTLREKSKRSTKGKHSSEKFQNIRLSKSPKSPGTTPTNKSRTSPHKQQISYTSTNMTTVATTTTTSSMLELQRIETCAKAQAPKTTTANAGSGARRKTTSTAGTAAVSPPIRAMLPPSSLYKVVGTPDTVECPPPRKATRGELQAGGSEAVIASPSLIVKFKKVRTAELTRLNGEAESFMFPKQRTSSELPTDIDRQTTSENAHGRSSSTSVDSSSDENMDVEDELERKSKSRTAELEKQVTGKRAIAIAKRRKDKFAKTETRKQRFPNAPIQPEVQLKEKQQQQQLFALKTASLSASATATTFNKSTTAKTPLTKTARNAATKPSTMSSAAAKANATAAVLAAITLPEATRKSSRTATAIVTAATTSSRLLRAAVEAAKYNCLQLVGVNNDSIESSGRKKYNANESAVAAVTKKAMLVATTRAAATKSSNKRKPVVKMEDRMGDVMNEKRKKNKKATKRTLSYSEDDNDTDCEDENNGKKVVTASAGKKCISIENKNVDAKDIEITRASVYGRGMKDEIYDDEDDEDDDEDADDADDDDDDDEDVDNDDEKDEDYVHCIRSRRKSVAYDGLTAVLWQGGGRSSGGPTSRTQRAAQREEQKYKLAMLTLDVNEKKPASAKGADEKGKKGGKRKKCDSAMPTKTSKANANTTATASIISSPTTFSKKNSTNKKNSDNASNVEGSASADTTSGRITPTQTKVKNGRRTFDLANSARLNQMRYSFERVPINDVWYRVFTRQDNCGERYFEYYGSKNYRKLPYELGPIPFSHTLPKGFCCKLCEKQRVVDCITSREEEKRDFSHGTTQINTFKVKKEPVTITTAVEAGDSEADGGASKSRHSISFGGCGKLKEENVNNANSTYANTISSNTTTTSNSTIYTHKHKKLAFLQRYRQEQQELQKRQAAEQQQMSDNSNQILLECESKATSTTSPADHHHQEQRIPRDRKRAGSTHSTTSSTSCASSTATTKTSKNRYLNKHLNKAAAAFLNLELPPRKSPREHASTLALVSCIIKQRQDSQSKPNSETDEPATVPAITTTTTTHTQSLPGGEEASITPSAYGATKMQKMIATTIGTTVSTSTSDPSSIVKTTTTMNNELPSAVLRSPRHTRSAAATPVEELRFTTVISENVKRMRRGQNKYDHSPPVALTQSPTISRKSGRGRPPRTYCGGLTKFFDTTGHTSTNQRSKTPNVRISSTTMAIGARRRRKKPGDGGGVGGWTMTGHPRRRHHSSYTGLLAQGSSLPSIRKTGSKKGVLEFEVDATALKALDAATKHTNVRQLEWQIDKYLQLYGREFDVDEDLARTLGNENGDVAATPPTASQPTTSTTSATRRVHPSHSLTASSTSTSAPTASTSKALRRVNSAAHVSARRNSTQVAPQTSAATNTPPPTDYFSSDFDLYDLFTNAVGGGGGGNASDDEQQSTDLGGKRKSIGFSLYSSLAMQKYFRKRKHRNSNPTGWPKVQKKKTSVRQQHMLARKIRFLQDIGELANNGRVNSIKEEQNAESSKAEEEDEEGVGGEREETAAVNCGEIQHRRGNGVITPPPSEANEVKLYEKRNENQEDDEDEEEADCDGDTELDVAESIPEDEDAEDDEEELEDDGETMGDSIDEEEEEEEELTRTERDADAEAAADADEEDALDADVDEATQAAATAAEDEDDDTLMDDDSNFMTARQHQRIRNRTRSRRRTNTSPPVEEKQLVTSSNVTSHVVNNCSAINNNGITSTPTKQLLFGGGSASLRRTPQLLNGSLGSCISPSEKAGDNSDIFTVSSDGLDTDLDISNSQHRCDDEHSHTHHHMPAHHHHNYHQLHHDQYANHQTPKRKFDLSKYAPNNATSSSCAAEVATAAVKSLAISQFLKKEVRVTCRRLRAPFRRYRYRR